MMCRDALVKRALVVSPRMGVEEALKAMHKASISYAPVLDDEGVVVGIFSLSRLLESALPVSLDLGGVSVPIESAPGMTKRLRKYMSGQVADVMQRPFRALHPDMPVETAIRWLREGGEPVSVVEKETGAFVGVITDESVLAALGA